jgi:hypothetical protein
LLCVSSAFRVREVELVLGRTKTSNREKDEKIESLEKRYDWFHCFGGLFIGVRAQSVLKKISFFSSATCPKFSIHLPNFAFRIARFRLQPYHLLILFSAKSLMT